MMGFSHTLGYAIKAISCLENPGQQTVLAHEEDIASKTNIPRPYLAKIINNLEKKGLISTKRGPGGGVSLAIPSDHISVLDVVEAVEGEEWFQTCMLGMDNCGASKYCPFVDLWSEIHEKIENALRKTTIAEVIHFSKRVTSPDDETKKEVQRGLPSL